MPSPEKTHTPEASRPIARLVVCFALLLLGAVSAARLEVVYLPAWSFPELTVVLRTSQPSEVDELTRRWIEPVESAIRAVGDVVSVAGQVWTTGGYQRVRFRSGTDAERKAGRLESELAALRRELPAGARLDVWPSGQGGERAAVVWIEGDGGRLGKSFVDVLRALPEVREVRAVGTPEQELRITAAPGTDLPAIERAVADRLAVKRLGEATAGGRRLPVLLRGSPETPFDELWVRHGDAVVPLASLADLEIRDAGSSEAVRLDGHRGPVLLIDRELGVSPLALERALRDAFESSGYAGRYRFLFNEAEPLRRLVERLLLGVAAASAVTGLLALLLGGLRAAALQLLALPVALASALTTFALAGLTLDVTTLPMLAIALGWCLFYPVFRGHRRYVVGATMIAGAAALAVAAALAGGRLAPLLQSPMRAFLWAQVGGIVALSILPAFPGPGRWLGLRAPRLLRPAAVGRPLRWALRNPWTVLLATATGLYVLLVVFGTALEPRPGNLRPSTVDLRVDLRFAQGTTLEAAEAQIALAEAEAGRLDEVAGHWSYFDERSGSVYAAVRPGERSAIVLRRLAGKLQAKLTSLGASAQVSALGGGGRRNSEEVRFTDSLEDRPETDKAATYYRLLLRSTDLKSLRLAHALVVERLLQHYRLRPRNVSSDWGRPSPLVELVPRPGTVPSERERAAGLLRRRASLPAARRLPGAAEVDLRIADFRAPREEDEVRQREELLGLLEDAGGSSLVAGHLFEARETLASPSVKRQAGRYVLPVTIRFFGNLVRFEDRLSTHLALASLVMPPACDLELPEINPFVLGPDRRRMLAVAGTLVALLLALAVCRLDSVAGGFLVLVPLTAAVAVAAAWIRTTGGRLDEMSLFALAASVVGSLALALHVVAARRRGREDVVATRRRGCEDVVATRRRGHEDYRWLVGQSLALGVAATGMAALLLVPGLGLDAERHPWAPPLQVAGVAGLGSVLASYLCLGALQRAASFWRARAGRRERRREAVARWRSPGPLELQGRGLVKVYGNGFTALSGLDFHLEPGIVGLLGPNGAGKTTLLRILCGLLAPTRGEVLYRGRPIDASNLPEYRRLVGFLPQEFNAYEGFTGERFLDYWALEVGIRDPRERRREVERVLLNLGLEEAAGRKVRDYSGGMRRRIGIARALLGEPPILIVDEPTTGLDVQSRNRLRESLLQRPLGGREGDLQVATERIILFSTHIASDVAAAAARILVLDQGRLLYDGPASGLIERARGSVFESLVDDRELRGFSHLYRVTTRVRTLEGIRVRAVVRDGEDPPGPLVEPNLEEAYLAVVGRRERRDGERSRFTGSLLDLESWRRVA